MQTKNSDITWHHVREYINNVQDCCVTRKNLLNYLTSQGTLQFSECYIDTLRNQLEKCGFLGKMKTTTGAVVCGKYYRIKPIPEDLSVGYLRKMYDEKIVNLQIDK